MEEVLPLSLALGRLRARLWPANVESRRRSQRLKDNRCGLLLYASADGLVHG